MKKTPGILALAIFPGTAMASGSEVLSLLWLMLLVFIIVVASLFIRKFSIQQKLIIFIVYSATAMLSFVLTNDMPYNKNMYFINSVNTAMPLLAWALTFAYYHKKSDKQD